MKVKPHGWSQGRNMHVCSTACNAIALLDSLLGQTRLLVVNT
jgi:hypothetical protein